MYKMNWKSTCTLNWREHDVWKHDRTLHAISALVLVLRQWSNDRFVAALLIRPIEEEHNCSSPAQWFSSAMECFTQDYLEYFDAQDLASESVVGTESSNAVEDLEAGCASTLVDDDSQSFACLSGQNDLNAVPVEGKQCSFESKHHDLQSQCAIPTTLDDGWWKDCWVWCNSIWWPSSQQHWAGYGSMDLYCETCQWKCEQPCLCACHALAYHYNMRSWCNHSMAEEGGEWSS